MTTDTRPAASRWSQGVSYSYVGNADFHRCLCDLLDSAQHELVDFVIPETRPDEHDRFILKAYGDAARRGVRCRTLIAPEHLHLVQSTWSADFDMRAFLNNFAHIRLARKVNGPFTVVDRKKVLLNIPDAESGAEYTTSIVVEDERLAEHLIAIFDGLWQASAGEQEDLLSDWESAEQSLTAAGLRASLATVHLDDTGRRVTHAEATAVGERFGVTSA